MSEFDRKLTQDLTPLETSITSEDLFLVAKKVGDSYVPFAATADKFEAAVGIPEATEALNSFTDPATLTTPDDATRVTGDDVERVFGQAKGLDKLGLTRKLIRLESEIANNYRDIKTLQEHVGGSLSGSNLKGLLGDYFPTSVRSYLDGLEGQMGSTNSTINNLNNSVGELTGTINSINSSLSGKADSTDVNELGLRVTDAESFITSVPGQLSLLASKTEVNDLDTYGQTTRSMLDIQAGSIALKADQTTVDTVQQQLNNAESSIDLAHDHIALRATKSELNLLDGRLTSAEADLNVVAGEVTAKASQSDFNAVEGRLTSAEGLLSITAGQVSAKASQSDLNSATNRLTNAEGILDILPGQIDLRATKTEHNLLSGEVSDLNTQIMQTAESISLMATRSEGGILVEGSTTSASTTRIIDSTKNFPNLGVQVGDLVVIKATANKGVVRRVAQVLTNDLVLDKSLPVSQPSGSAYSAGHSSDVLSAAFTITASEISQRLLSSTFSSFQTATNNSISSLVARADGANSVTGTNTATNSSGLTDSTKNFNSTHKINVGDMVLLVSGPHAGATSRVSSISSSTVLLVSPSWPGSVVAGTSYIAGSPANVAAAGLSITATGIAARVTQGDYNSYVNVTAGKLSALTSRTEGGTQVTGTTNTTSTSSQVRDTTKNFPALGVAVGDMVLLTPASGNLRGLSRRVSAVANGTLTVSPSWPSAPPSGTAYTAGSPANVSAAGITMSTEAINLRVTSTTFNNAISDVNDDITGVSNEFTGVLRWQGTTTSSSSSQIVDSSKNFTNLGVKPGYMATIKSGTHNRQSRRVSAVGTTSVTVSPNWPASITSGTSYEIGNLGSVVPDHLAGGVNAQKETDTRLAGGVRITGTTDSTSSTTQVKDSTKNFITLGVKVGDLVAITNHPPNQTYKAASRRISAVANGTLTVTPAWPGTLPTGTGYVAGSVGDVSAAGISVASDEINLKVNKNGVISAINVSEEGVKVLGNKITLDGNVTVTGAFTVGGASGKVGLNDNAVTTSKLANSAVDSNKLASNAVVAAKIASNAITETKIINNAITSGKIAANSITARHLIIGDTSNMVTNPMFLNGSDGWVSLDSSPVDLTNDSSLPASAAGRINVETGTNNFYFTSTYFPVKAGEKYYVGAWVRRSSANANFNLGINFFDNANGQSSTPLAITATTGHANNSWVWYDGVVTAPANRIKGRIRGYATGNASPSGHWLFTGVEVRRMAGTTLISDGAITTSKITTGAITAGTIAANAITAAKISANAVEASKIKAGAITADKISAGVITTDKLTTGEINISTTGRTSGRVSARDGSGAIKAAFGNVGGILGAPSGFYGLAGEAGSGIWIKGYPRVVDSGIVSLSIGTAVTSTWMKSHTSANLVTTGDYDLMGASGLHYLEADVIELVATRIVEPYGTWLLPFETQHATPVYTYATIPSGSTGHFTNVKVFGYVTNNSPLYSNEQNITYTARIRWVFYHVP